MCHVLYSCVVTGIAFRVLLLRCPARVPLGRCGHKWTLCVYASAKEADIYIHKQRVLNTQA